ncbi:MAG: TolB-like translocation protein [Pirellulaceae bacterium]
MFRRICGVTCLAMVGVAILATTLAAAKPPTTSPPPPNLGGVLYFLRDGQVWQMNGDGSGKAPALPLTYLGRPSSRLYNGCRWWLYPKDMDGIGQTMDFELFAFRFVPDGSPYGRYEEVQLTDLPYGFSVKWNSDEIQWSNDGVDSFCSVLVYAANPEEQDPHPPAYLYRFPIAPEFFDPAVPPMDLTDGEIVLDDSDITADVLDPLWWSMSEYSWSPSGTQIAYSHPIEQSNYKLRIKTLDPDLGDHDIPLSSQRVEKLSNVSWSPDGEQICFYGWIRGSDGSLRSGDWTVRPDGSQLTQLYEGYSGYNGGKKWSLLSDPSWVTYEDTNNTGIFLVKPDKSAGPYNLTSDLPTSKKNPEKRELVDWVGTEDVIAP